MVYCKEREQIMNRIAQYEFCICVSLQMALVLFSHSALGEALQETSPGTNTKNLQNTSGQDRGEVVEGFTLSAQLKQLASEGSVADRRPSKIGAGGVVRVVATLTNTTAKELSFVETDPEVDFIWNVMQSEKAVPRTLYGSKILERRSSLEEFRRVIVKLPPGKSLPYEFHLSRQFDLSLPGVYTVQVSCNVLRSDGSGTSVLTSNELLLTVEDNGQRGGGQPVGGGPLKIDGAKIATEDDAFQIASNAYTRKMVTTAGLRADEGVSAISTITLGFDVPDFAKKGEVVWTATAADQLGAFRGLMWIHPNTEKVVFVVGAWDVPDEIARRGRRGRGTRRSD
jgi:hypothetical protein